MPDILANRLLYDMANGAIPNGRLWDILTAIRRVKMQQDRTMKHINRKRFVRYKEGAEIYSMCQSKFEQIAKDAKAIYKVDKLVLVNCDIFEEYLETFRMYV